MIKKIISLTCFILILTSCVKSNLSTFGRGVSISFDPRTVGMQIDDTIMQKNIVARLTLTEKKYFLYQRSNFGLGVRHIQYCTSYDLLEWSDFNLVEYNPSINYSDYNISIYLDRS